MRKSSQFSPTLRKGLTIPRSTRNSVWNRPVRFPVRILAILATVAVAAGPSWAGWITIRNDTTQELVIQDVVMVNGKAKAGKSIKLLPDESVRENQTKAGGKTLYVYDAANTKTILARGKLEWATDDVTYSIQTVKNATTVAVVPPPPNKP